MASISGQPQFRYTQPPSKVIHLRNLPWECTEEELIELGKPFGEVVNTKCNVGANRNQAFIEFSDLNQAIAMISYYAASAEPAQVRGKTVYLQYSNRQEIVNSKATGDTASNVLLVTMEGVEPDDVSIDVLHLVFSAFGFVHKIATFEKTAGFQALIQFSDSETASSARNALDGRSIPRYLLPEHVGVCTLKITFSAHSVLNVKFQSHRSRDYTNPYLPVAPSAIDGSGQDGKKQEPESNVLLASVENMQYTVTIDVLHMIFSAFGFVQKIAIFEKNSGFQALIQYPDIQTAITAKEALEGHSIYEGGLCILHLTFSRHTDLNVKVNNDRGRDYTGGNRVVANNQPSILGPQPIPPLRAFMLPYNSIPYPAASNSTMVAGAAANLTAPVARPAALVPQPASQPYSQPATAPPGVLPQMIQFPSHGALELPPGVTPQFPSHGAPPFPPATSPQMQMMQQLPGQESQQVLPMPHLQGHVNQQFTPGMVPKFMQFPGQGSPSDPNAPSQQVMQLPGHGGQQFPPGLSPQVMQVSGYGSQQFPQGPSPQMPPFPVHGNQQLPLPGTVPHMMQFPGQGSQHLPFAQPHPYNH